MTASADFEFDPDKSAANKARPFVEAQAIWDDERRLEIPARTKDEPRFIVIGSIADQHWSAVITYRNERVRLISVRRARSEEVKLYES